MPAVAVNYDHGLQVRPLGGDFVQDAQQLRVDHDAGHL